MARFKNSLLALIDNSAAQAKNFIEDFNDAINSFNFDAQMDYFNERKNELIKRGNSLFNDFQDFFKQVKDTLSDFSVTIPFEEGESIDYKVEDGNILVIKTSFKNETTSRSSETSVMFPKNCDVERITLETNKKNKTATITIPKKILERDDERRKKKTVKKRPTTDETKKEKFRRDASGRFVRKED